MGPLCISHPRPTRESSQLQCFPHFIPRCRASPHPPSLPHPNRDRSLPSVRGCYSSLRFDLSSTTSRSFIIYYFSSCPIYLPSLFLCYSPCCQETGIFLESGKDEIVNWKVIVMIQRQIEVIEVVRL